MELWLNFRPPPVPPTPLSQVALLSPEPATNRPGAVQPSVSWLLPVTSHPHVAAAADHWSPTVAGRRPPWRRRWATARLTRNHWAMTSRRRRPPRWLRRPVAAGQAVRRAQSRAAACSRAPDCPRAFPAPVSAAWAPPPPRAPRTAGASSPGPARRKTHTHLLY